jgi:demethylmenaquinone methyltransferase/2-methoxy-6-polyprenyl-1,4-benzoquinol methylase
VLLWLGQSIGSPGKVVGIDRSGGMLAQAAGKLQKAALSTRADLVNGDAVHLPFQADFCDGIIMSFTLELFLPEEMIAVLAECRRVLKHAGRLCVVAMAETTDPGSMYRVYAWGPRIFPEWIDCRPIDVQSALSQASFQIRDVIEIGMWGLPIRIVLAEKS